MKFGLSKYLKLIRPVTVFSVFIILAIIMLSSALIELHQSKKELLSLMDQQAHTLSESILISSHNTIMTNILVEQLIEERLLNNAVILKRFYEEGNINNQFLKEFAQRSNIFRINIFNKNGEKVYSNHEPIHQELSSHIDPQNTLEPIFSGKKDTLIIGLKETRYEDGKRYALAVSARDRSAIVLNLDASELLEFRRQIGLGSLLKKVIHNPGVVYAVLQDTNGILAASGNVREMGRILGSPFLQQALQDSLFLTRVTQFDSIQVFEAVHPFYFEGSEIGLFRLGISLLPLEKINQRIYRRIIIIAIILFIIGFILLMLFFVRDTLESTRKQYQTVETFSQNVLQNVNDGILVVDSEDLIQVVNEATESILNLKASDVIGKKVKQTIDSKICDKLFSEGNSIKEITCRVNGKSKTLLISKNRFLSEENKWTTILVLRDLTELKRLENQVQRRE